MLARICGECAPGRLRVAALEYALSAWPLPYSKCMAHVVDRGNTIAPYATVMTDQGFGTSNTPRDPATVSEVRPEVQSWMHHQDGSAPTNQTA